MLLINNITNKYIIRKFIHFNIQEFVQKKKIYKFYIIDVRKNNIIEYYLIILIVQTTDDKKKKDRERESQHISLRMIILLEIANIN